MLESFLCFALASPSSNPSFSGHARFAFPRTRGKPRDEQGWKRILKETAGYAFPYFDDVLGGAYATSDGPGFRFRQRTSCIPMRRYRSARWVRRMLVTSFFFWYFFFFDLDIIETNQAYGQCFLFSLFRHSVVKYWQETWIRHETNEVNFENLFGWSLWNWWIWRRIVFHLQFFSVSLCESVLISFVLRLWRGFSKV